MNALAQGATRYNMSKSQFLALELLIPSCDEQQAIASILSDMDAEIARVGAASRQNPRHQAGDDAGAAHGARAVGEA